MTTFSMTKSLFDQIVKHLEATSTTREWWAFHLAAKQEINEISYEHNINHKSYEDLKKIYT